MDELTRLGTMLFGFSMVVFGIQQFLYTGVVAGLEFVPEGIPAHTLVAYASGTVLVVAGIGIALEKRARAAALVLALGFLLSMLLLRGAAMGAILSDIRERTRVFETLALCAGALIVARAAAPEPASFQRWNHAAQKLAMPARYLLAICLIIFGLDHFQVAGFIATLIPGWIPGHLFWAYFTGIAFLAAALAIALGKYLRYTGMLLGLMFLLWVIVLHGPRVAGNLHNGNEWNSAMVALAMSGFALLLGPGSGETAI